MGPELNYRIGRSNIAFRSRKAVFKDRRISFSARIALYKSIVLNTLLYGLEGAPMAAADRRVLQTTVNRHIRSMLGLTLWDKVRNDDIHRNTGLADVGEILTKRRLTYYGHVVRRSEDRLIKRAPWSVPTGGRRRRGRGNCKWLTNVEKDLETTGLNPDWAKDRLKWREKVSEL